MIGKVRGNTVGVYIEVKCMNDQLLRTLKYYDGVTCDFAAAMYCAVAFHHGACGLQQLIIDYTFHELELHSAL